MIRPFSPFDEFTQFMVCVTKSVWGGRTCPVAACMFRVQYFGTAASKLKLVIGTFNELENLARIVEEPFASLRGKKVTFKPFFSKATMGGASWAATGGAGSDSPPKMSSKPRSPPPPGPGAGAAAPPPPPSSKSRRSPAPPPPPPPPTLAGATGAGPEGCDAGASSRSFKSSKSLPPAGGALAPPPEGTSSIEESPTSLLSAPPISLSGTGIRSRMPAR
mmetsp:Transcript_63447/g.148609  ORF Transcript_63447/g.148609 Transcript_63447/m.148609 type:complete len:219 (-) Transcript_63447:1778-2434(-)